MKINEDLSKVLTRKEEEYFQCLNQLKICSENDQNRWKIQFNQLKQDKQLLHEQNNRKLIEIEQKNEEKIREDFQEKINHLNSLISSADSLRIHLENVQKTNSNENEHVNEEFSRKNLRLLCLFYQNQIDRMTKTFSEKTDRINEKIEYLEEMKEIFDEQFHIELNQIEEFYQKKITKILNEHQQLQNEEILFNIRVN